MLKYLLDTNIVIYTIKNRPESLRQRFNHHAGQMAISSVTVAELIYGIERSARPEENLAVIEGFMARLELLAFDSEAAIQSGQIRAEVAARGTPIGPYDVMIAGQARASGLILVTNNLKEFERVEGLRLENWVA